MRLWSFLLIAVLTLVSCAKTPPNLSPTGARTFQANQAVVALGTLQHAAIELNKVQVCEPAPCHPLLTDTNTGVVVDNVTSALTAMRAVPTGWKATATQALDTIQMRLDESGKTTLTAYISMAVTIINGLIGGTA